MEQCFRVSDFPSVPHTEEELNAIPSSNRAFNTSLNTYLTKDKVFNGDLMQADWFPTVNADIFISHSHKNCPELVKLIAKLEERGAHCFIDSLVWGYADKLLRKIDNDSNYYKTYGQYLYSERNKTTAFIHIMLNAALLKMIDKCKYVMFFETEEAVSCDDVVNSPKTYSPWIYSEISMCNAILADRKKILERQRYTLSKEQFMHFSEAFKGQMSVDLKEFQKIPYSKITKWLKDSDETGADAFIKYIYPQKQILCE